jgi:fatty acid desaturase
VPGRLASIVEPRLAGIGVALMLLGAGAAWLGLWPGLLWIGLAWGSMGLWLAHAFAIAPLYSDSCDCAEYTELGAEI